MSTKLPFSEACERNKGVILEAISPTLNSLKTVLEIGSGTAQHAVHFAKAHPNLKWQTSDQSQYLEGIEAQLQVADVDNVIAPFELDVTQRPWCQSGQKYDAVYTANSFHIMTEDNVIDFFDGVPNVLNDKATLIVYGPFKYDQKFTSESNQQFDLSLRSRECGSAIRDFEWINSLAEKAGLKLIRDLKMPANNQLLFWQA